jgi:ketosteroid isomerase-like protein
MSPVATVRACLQAYVDKDRVAIEALVAADFQFTSPLDNALDRATYFARCWPNSEAMTAGRIVESSESGDQAFVIYEAEFAGRRFRNFELHRVRAGQVVAVEVYFGWNLPHPAAPGQFVTDQPDAPADRHVDSQMQGDTNRT